MNIRYEKLTEKKKMVTMCQRLESKNEGVLGWGVKGKGDAWFTLNG